jgi:DNA-binding GntR family transcriptional regulator
VAADSLTDTQKVVSALRDAIARGDLAPNQRLIEQDICTAYNASRATVRSALAALATEGLVERIQNRGARVRSVPISEAIEILEVRTALEAMCASQAAAKLTDEGRQILQALGEDMRHAIDSGDLYRYSDLNNRLHEAVLEYSQHGTAAAVIHRLKGQVVRHQFRLNLRSGGPAGSLAEHLEIIDAICAGDSDRAEDAMKRHLLNVADALRERAIEGQASSSA